MTIWSTTSVTKPCKTTIFVPIIYILYPVLRVIPNSLHKTDIFSHSSSLPINFMRSSIILLSFHVIVFASKCKKCILCLQNFLYTMSQEGHSLFLLWQNLATTWLTSKRAKRMNLFLKHDIADSTNYRMQQNFIKNKILLIY